MTTPLAAQRGLDPFHLDRGIDKPPARRAGGRRITRRDLKISIIAAADELVMANRVVDRDYRLLDTLQTIHLLSRNQIHRLFWNGEKSVTAVNTRLRKLYESHILDYRDYVEPEMAASGLEPCRIYVLDSVGQELLARHKGFPNRSQLGEVRGYSLGSGGQLLMHDVMMAEWFTSAWLASDQQQLKFGWWNERQSIIHHPTRLNTERLPVELTRPDGTWFIEKARGLFIYYLELDRGHTDWDKKVIHYQQGYTNGQWEQQLGQEWFPPVLCLVPDKRYKSLNTWLPNQGGRVRYLLRTWPAFWQSDPFEGWLDTVTGKQVSLLTYTPG